MIHAIMEAPECTSSCCPVFSMTSANTFPFWALTTLSRFFSITRMQMCPNPLPHPGSAHLVLFDVLLDSLQTISSLCLHGQWQPLLDPCLERIQRAGQRENAPQEPCISTTVLTTPSCQEWGLPLLPLRLQHHLSTRLGPK